MKNSNKKHLAVFAFIVVIGVLVFQSYFLYDLQRDFSDEMDILKTSIKLLDNKIDNEAVELENEINVLRDQSGKAIKDLGGNIDALLKESSESKKAIKELSEGLEELENVQINANKDFSSIVEEVIESVVSVRAGNSLGSGVFVSPKYVVTNYHVVKGNVDNLKITNVDNKVYSVDLVGYEQDIDLAVLRLNNGNFPYLEFEDINKVNVGQSVIAVGSPLGLSFSVTQGIVSSKSRTGPNGLNIYLQTDTPINPGNSGGPLIGLNKKIVAINTWKIGGVEGLGFSIRSDVVKDIYEQIIEQV